MLLLNATLAGAVAALAPALPATDGCSSGATVAAHTDRGQKNIVETAVAAGSFETLAAALKAGDLVEALQGEGPFTVFAPTDAAFAALPKGTLETLLTPEGKPTLQAILKYHVVSGEVLAKDVVKRAYATTLNGQRLAVSVDDQGVSIGGAWVTTTDVRCTNGVIHVVDAVLLPNTDDLVATAVKSKDFPTLTTAIQAAGLAEALRGRGPFTVFAPSEAAFAKLPAGTVEELLKPESRERLTAILKLHVVPGRVYSDAAAKGAEVKTLDGQALHTRSEGDAVLVGDARVVAADIDCANGVIHVIDSVLLPR